MDITGMVLRLVDDGGAPPRAGRVWTQQWTEATGMTWARFDAAPDGVVRVEASDVPPLWAEADGLARTRLDASRRMLTLTGPDADLGDVVLRPGPRVRGRLVDGGGGPIVGARVTVRPWSWMLGHSTGPNGPDYDLVTDRDGRFVSPPLPPGDALVHVLAPGRASTSREISLGALAADLDLGDARLAPGRTVRGVVRSTSGELLAGARVRIEGAPFGAVKTAADGTFELPGSSREPLNVVVAARGYRGTRYRLEASPADEAAIALEPAREIAGEAVDARTGAPVRITELNLCTVIRRREGAPLLAG